MIPETEDDDRAERTMFISREQLFGATTTPDLISHYLVVLEGGAPGRRLEIDTAPITIGRGATQTLVCRRPGCLAAACACVAGQRHRRGRGSGVDQRHLRRRTAHHRRGDAERRRQNPARRTAAQIRAAQPGGREEGPGTRARYSQGERLRALAAAAAASPVGRCAPSGASCRRRNSEATRSATTGSTRTPSCSTSSTCRATASVPPCTRSAC